MTTPRGFASWTPEQREEARRKASETRARKAEEKRQRRGAADRSPSRRSLPISKVQVQHGVRAVVIGVDAGLAYLVPELWVTDPNPELSDRLTEREIDMLVVAFSDEAMKHPRVLRFLANLTAYTDRLGIAGVLLLIALPRLARRGMIPAFLTPVLRDLLGAATAAEVAPEPPQPAPQNPEEASPNREAA